jgi:hypothetical protein
MKRLTEIVDSFKVSRPIFLLTKPEDSDRISSDVDTSFSYEPIPIDGDVLSEIACRAYQQTFNIQIGVFELNKKGIIERAVSTMRSAMYKFLEKNLEMKNPRQSKICKWYAYSMPETDDFNEVVVMLYKYMRTFCDQDMRSHNIEHCKNTLALLEAIMEKYENKS